MTAPIAIAYVPVLHEGYRRFIQEHGGDKLYLIGSDFTREFKPILKEIRALEPETIARAIRALGWSRDVTVLTATEAMRLSEAGTAVMLADEDISREIADIYLAGCEVKLAQVFLRWDRHRTVGETTVNPDRVVSQQKLDQEIMQYALDAASHSADWWRHVGAVLAHNGEVILAVANQPVPSQHTPYTNGDPRNNFSKGVHLDLSTVLHSEARVIAEAAKRGLSVAGMSLYVTTFPCPPCAKLIAYSGVKRLYYAAGYGVLDGESILHSQGVEIILVDMANPPTS